MKLRLFFIAIMIMPMMLLSGCATKYRVGQEYGTYCSKEHQCNLMDAVRGDGAFVYQLGDTISIVIPQDRIFQNGATILFSGKQKTLDDIANLLACYQKISVKVVLYVTDDDQTGIAKMRARAIEHYLTTQKMNARLFYSVVKTRQSNLQNTIEFVTLKLP